MLRLIKISLMVLLLQFNIVYADEISGLNQLLQQFQSLSANFSQELTDSQGMKSVTSGTLILKKPNQFRWEVNSPNQQLFISNGKELWNVEPDLEQVSLSPLEQNLSTTPLL